MYNNIDEKIKGLAIIIVIISLAGGGIWLLYSISQYSDYHEFLQYGDINDYYIRAVNAKHGIIYSIVSIISGTILSYLIYGFGELLYHVKRINEKPEDIRRFELKEKPTENDTLNDSSY
jgi:hypothetical protein